MYIGRFAPSPTGPLHLGSLLCALASYLDAKHYKGDWLIRVEDIDPPREQVGALESILNTLQRFSLNSDIPILKQSDRHTTYIKKIQLLSDQGLTYKCVCTRRDLAPFQNIHPYETCPRPREDEQQPYSVRVKAPNVTITVDDLCQPRLTYNLQTEAGDFILLRKDSLIAYHLAVTTDDAHQGITHIVRGRDLLHSTPQQMYLQSLFKYQQPIYLHLPVITHNDGHKFSKQTFAPSIENAPVNKTLVTLLHCLGQNPPRDLHKKTTSELLNWGIKAWNRSNIPKQESIPIEQIETIQKREFV